jgi:hypothetical protein
MDTLDALDSVETDHADRPRKKQVIEHVELDSAAQGS